MSSDKKGAASAAAAGAEEPAASRKKEKAQMPLDYVIMSLPVRAEGEKPTVWNQHVDFVTKEKVGRSAQFEIPDLPVGTFDTLMSLSDELGRVDTFAESLCRKIITTLTELYNSPSLFWFSYHCFTLNFYKHITVTMYFHGTASGFATKSLPPWTVNGVSPDAFMAQFAWDEKKFPHKSPLRETVSRVQTLLQRLDGDLRSHVSKYTTAERAMAADARKETGTLATRSLADVVKPSDVVDTEYLTTVFVVVPKHAYKDFGAQYETLSEFVLPRSAVLLKEDSDSGLYSVTVFKRTVDDFKNTARDRRYVVRDVDLASLTQESREDCERRANEKKNLENKLNRWCLVNFGEVFSAWLHIKAIRVFVESVLRYGLPPCFVTPVLCPAGKNRDLKKTLAQLTKIYQPIIAASQSGIFGGGKGKGKGKEDDLDAYSATAGGPQEKLLPFVYTLLHLDLVPQSL